MPNLQEAQGSGHTKHIKIGALYVEPARKALE